MKKLNKIFTYLTRALTDSFYGFVYEDDNLTKKDKLLMQKHLDFEDKNCVFVKRFEYEFSKLIGKGKCVSYAAARMAFYDLLKVLNVGSGDEVILLGSTCAAMPSAVLRCGATPIYTDIDPDTLGSDPRDIARKITSKTKVIVAQHSFGMPCKIEEIKKFANKKDIFLLEDCALCLGSAVNNELVGNFGDASIFSTYHSKPLSTLLGGMIFTKNTLLAERLTKSRNTYPDFSQAKKESIYNQIIYEAKYCNPKKYGKKFFLDYLRVLYRRFRNTPSPFIEDNGCYNSKHEFHPYPAKLPSFIAILGLIKIKNWEATKLARISELKVFLDFSISHKLVIPRAYLNKRLTIIPLRFVWLDSKSESIRARAATFLDVSWIWFMKPIIATQFKMDTFRYKNKSCPVSEMTGRNIINIPSNLPMPEFIDLLARIDRLLSCIKLKMNKR